MSCGWVVVLSVVVITISLRLMVEKKAGGRESPAGIPRQSTLVFASWRRPAKKGPYSRDTTAAAASARGKTAFTNRFFPKDPDAIRAALTDKMIEASSKLARFVGLDAYKAAGGITRADLFGDEVYLEKPALLNKLAQRSRGQHAGAPEPAPPSDCQKTHRRCLSPRRTV